MNASPRYRITHATEYRYGETVPAGHHLVHLQPRDTFHQTCQSSQIHIAPDPATARHFLDYFGNRVTWFNIQEPHQNLAVKTISEVQVDPYAPPAGLICPSWDEVGEALSTALDQASLDARQYVFDSHYIHRRAELAEYARPSFPAGAGLLDAVFDLTHRIHDEFIFDSTATTVGTPVLEVLKRKRGVCQDFAHLQIACLRSLGLPARYVSGYLLTRPPPGKTRLLGADASHAWVGVFFPGYGWIDFDPTNSIIPSSEHITVGWARDYEDLAPVKGVITGGHRHVLKVSVDVEPIAAAGAVSPAAAPTPAGNDGLSASTANVPTN